ALVYPVAALAALLLVRRTTVPQLLLGVWAGIALVCVYALATRLFPDRLGTTTAIVGRRLAAPIGYWNALGLLAAIGTLLALGLAARARLPVRALAGSSLVVLVPTLLFTFSRGAWLSLAVGVAVAVAV